MDDQHDLAIANDQRPDQGGRHADDDAPRPDGALGRSTREVLDDHLALAAAGDWRTDLERNVADDMVVLTGFGVFVGRDQVRVIAELLAHQVPDATFEYTTVLVQGDVAFLEWTARGPTARVDDGADTFVIRDGRIVVQTIHYTVQVTVDDIRTGTPEQRPG